jgi:hypothetical protein
VALHAEVQGLEALQEQERVEGREAAADVAEDLQAHLQDEGAAALAAAAAAAPLAAAEAAPHSAAHASLSSPSRIARAAQLPRDCARLSRSGARRARQQLRTPVRSGGAHLRASRARRSFLRRAL